MKTLEAAQKIARSRAGKEAVTILVEDGTYYLDKPLVLTSEDSGSANAPLFIEPSMKARPFSAEAFHCN